MQIMVAAQSLLEALNNVTRALSARPSKPILEGVLMDAENDLIQLTCTDGSLTIRTSIEGQVEREGQIVLPGKLFTELVRKLPGGMVSITVNEKLIASIKCLSSRTTLAGMSPVDFPVMTRMEGGSYISMPQKKFKDMISRVVFAIATDESRQILTGCLLEVTPAEARLVALDGFRLALQKFHNAFQLSEGQEVLSCVIPGKVLSELSKIMSDSEDPITLKMDKSRLQASFDKTELSAVLLAGEYINYKQILPSDWQSRIKVRKSELADAIDRASLMAREGKNNLIRMHIDENALAITSNAELGDVREELEVALEGKGLDIAFNARYLSDVIRNISEDDLCMRFNSNVSPCVICPAEGDQYVYLVLPVRVFN